MSGNDNASEADYLAQRISQTSANQQARGLAIFWKEIRNPKTDRRLEDALDVALELLVAVYRRAGRLSGRRKGYRLAEGSRAAVRELLREEGLLDRACEDPDDDEEGEDDEG